MPDDDHRRGQVRARKNPPHTGSPGSLRERWAELTPTERGFVTHVIRRLSVPHGEGGNQGGFPVIPELMDEFRQLLMSARGRVDVEDFVKKHAASIGGEEARKEVTYQAWAAVVWYRGLEKISENFKSMDIKEVFPPDS